MGKLKTNSRKVFCRVLPLLAALILILGSCLTVSAEDDPYNISELENLGYYHLMKQVEGSGTYYVYLTYSYPLYYYADGSTAYLKSSKNQDYLYYISDDSMSTWGEVRNGTLNNSNLASRIDENYSILFSSYDIKDIDDNVVFPGPVPPLVKAAEGIAPEEVMKETIGLLPLLIPFLVGLVGFWKGWQFLLRILRKA